MNTSTTTAPVSADTDQVLYDVAEGIATITLNRPDRQNTITRPMLAAFSKRLVQANADPEVRVVIVTGAGRFFCAGLDLRGGSGIGEGRHAPTLDLREAQAQDIVRRLVREADVLIENFRPGAMEGWGLGPEALLAINPRLVMLRVSGFGQSGPYRDKPGFGVVAEAMGGLRHLTAEPGRVPVRVGVSIGDTLAALHGVIGILMALRERERSGLGQVIDVALYEAVFNCMESLLPDTCAFGVVREPAGIRLPGLAPRNPYHCAAPGYRHMPGPGRRTSCPSAHPTGPANPPRSVPRRGRHRLADRLAFCAWMGPGV